MARTPSITDDQLLEAARAEFLENGIRATTTDIARRAGVSQGILFHRFGSKEALFAAAMGHSDAPPATVFDLKARVGHGSVEKTLIELGELLLDRFFDIVPTQIMTWANRATGEDIDLASGYRGPGVRGQRQLVDYLRAESTLGRVRLVDPFVTAQAFSGALWFFAFEQVTQAKLRGKTKSPSRVQFVRQLVATLWRGIRP